MLFKLEVDNESKTYDNISMIIVHIQSNNIPTNNE